MKYKVINKENIRKQSRLLKKRTERGKSIIRTKAFTKSMYVSYNLLPLFIKNQNMLLQKNITSILFLEELGFTFLFSF